jgi:predicted NBD/HSP70 family sugar kinase
MLIGMSKLSSKAELLQVLRMQGAMPRSRLADLTGLSRATVSGAISELMRAGLVEETDARFTTGGRPAFSVQLTPDSRAVIGADFNDQAWRLAAFDLAGNLLADKHLPVADATPETAVDTLIMGLTPFCAQLSLPIVPVLGLGVPGLVDARLGVIRYAVDVGWTDVALGSAVSESVGWPTVLLNRHRARGLAECRYGAGSGYGEVLYVGVGTGIAAGLFMQGRLINGAVGGAGEIGHTTLSLEGPVCSCGNRGCLQALAASPAVEQVAFARIKAGAVTSLASHVHVDLPLVHISDICSAAQQGDSLACEALQTAGAYLGVALANLVNTFNPEMIVLGGTLPSRSPLYTQAAEQAMRQHALTPLAAATMMQLAQLPNTGGALGAAAYALDQHVALCLSD